MVNFLSFETSWLIIMFLMNLSAQVLANDYGTYLFICIFLSSC